MIFAVALLAIGIAIACYYVRHYAVRIEPFLIDTPRYEVDCPGLPPEFDGLAICQISDVHISASPRNETAIADALRAMNADLYVLTGDYVFMQSGVDVFFRWIDSLGGKARPAVAILGNAEHKSYIRQADILDGFRERNIPLLRNEVRQLPIRGAILQIVGVDDPHTHHCDFPLAYAKADPTQWTLLLCHSPDGITQLNGYRADLALCGHTHGGQVRLPVLGALHTNLRRAKGLVAGWYTGEALAEGAKTEVGAARLYVCRGLGAGGFTGRLLCRPELPVFVLRAR